MKHLKRLVLALLLPLCLVLQHSNSLADTSGNLIDSNNWTGATYGADPGGCCASISGSGPLYDTSTGTIMFSYGQSTISQTIGLNQALGGTGIQVSGYNYSWDYRLISNNGNGGDTLTATISLKNSAGSVVETENLSYTGAAHDTWFSVNGSKTFSNPYTDPQSISLSFTGKDGGFWAGYYGPELKNISLRATYSSDPCATNPLYSTSCPGYAQAFHDQQCTANPLYATDCPGYAQAYFNQQCGFNPLYDTACPGNSSIITSGNLVPRPGGWYQYVNQSFAINQALSHSGTGLKIHAFQWGFRSFNMGGILKSDVNIRDSNNNSIYSFTTDWQTPWVGYQDHAYYYQLPQSKNNLTLGTFEYTTQAIGIIAVGDFYARALYTPDSCSLDPLSSPQCTGYQAAFLQQQCLIYALYSPECPGYAEALQKMLDEQAALLETDSTTGTDPVAAVANTTTSTAPTSTEDPTRDQAQVTTDVGGAEITTTGEVVASDGVPSDVKESVKESAKASDSKSQESSDKKKSRVNAVALAQSAARRAEQTALSAATDAQLASLSENANPADGIGLTGLGTGLTIPGLRLLQGFGTNNVAAENHSVRTASANPRARSVEQDTANTSDSAMNNKEVAATNVAKSAEVIQSNQETVSTGPSVRRGGAVEGMNGGDMSALARTPANFNDYLGKQLQDSQFYAARDIYRGQRTVDNVRALRGLGTDRLHQQMVDQQYGR